MYRFLPTILILFVVTLSAQPAFAAIQRHSLSKILLTKIILQQQTTTQIAQISIGQIKISEKKVSEPPPPQQTKSSNEEAQKDTPPGNASLNEITDYIMNEINNYRSANGLSAVRTSSETCDFAKTRAKEIIGNFNHDGFRQRIDAHTIPYAKWSKVTENIAMTSEYKNVVKMWENSPGHAANMRAATSYVCVEQDGNYFAYVGMEP